MSAATCCKMLQGARTRCGGLLDFSTDALGRVVSSCPLCARTAHGICRACPARVTGRQLWCADCHIARRRESVRRYTANHRDTRNSAARTRWKKDPAYRARKVARRKRWVQANPDKVKASKRRYLLKQPEAYLAYHRAYNAQPDRAEKKRALALERYYQLHPTRPAPRCTSCGKAIPYVPPGRPPKLCTPCAPPAVARRRKREHLAVAA